MKLIILNKYTVNDLSELKSLDTENLNGLTIRYNKSNESVYEYQKIKQNDDSVLSDDENGYWTLKQGLITDILTVKDENYNININPDAKDIDITTPESLHNYGAELVGKFYAFNDWKCLRDSIARELKELAGQSLENFETNLSPLEQELCKIYIPTQLITFKEMDYFVGICEGDSLEEKMQKASSYINNYISQTQGDVELHLMGAYWKRWRASINYFYSGVGRVHGLILVAMSREDGVRHLYTSFGVLSKSEDGISGFKDWLMSIEDYENKGCKHYLMNLSEEKCPPILLDSEGKKLIDVDAENMHLTNAVDTFVNGAVAIIENGTY